MITDASIGDTPINFVYVGDKLAWQRKAEIPNDYVLRYDFDGDFNDQSSALNHGVKKGVVTFVAGRKEGTQGAYFDGAGSIATKDRINASTTAVSFSFWVEYALISSNKWLFRLRGSSGGYIDVTTKGSSREGAMMEVINSQAKSNNSMSLYFPREGWQHIVLVIDRADVLSSEIKVFVNGVNETFGGVVGSDLSDLIVNPELIVGFSSSVNVPSGAAAWKGGVQDLRLYDRVLSVEEIQALYEE